MNKEELPLILYKYRTWSDEYHKRMLTHNEIYFAKPGDFNDPFDSTIRIRFEDMSPPERFARFIEGLMKAEPGVALNQHIHQAKSYTRMWEHPNMPADFDTWRLDWLNRRWGIFTASSKFDNILMWSHYSDSHKGFCIGLRTDVLQQHFHELWAEPRFSVQTNEVTYSKEYPLLTNDRIPDAAWYRQQFSTKYEDWKYEREWRLTVVSTTTDIPDKDRSQPIPPECVSDIILGCRIPPDDKEWIIGILRTRKPRVRLLQARGSGTRFGLDLEEVDY